MKITKAAARKVLATIDAGLVYGMGSPEPGRMCVEAAVCYALGLPHSDNPVTCVSQVIRHLKIALNDAAWSSSAARAAGMRKLAILQLGTNKDFDNIEFACKVSEMTIRKVVPRALRATGLPALEAAALRCEAEGTSASARYAADAARYAEYAADAADAAKFAKYAARYAEYAADAARCAEEYAARCAADAAKFAANAAKFAEEYAAKFAELSARNARNAAKYDAELVFFAEEVAQILISMEVPAVKWLDIL